MNSQEHAALETFLNQLVQAHGVGNIAEASAMIQRAVDQQPDAAYLLVQRSLLLGQALNQAKARISELERAQEKSNRGFLDSGTPPGWPASAAPASFAVVPPGRPPISPTGPSFQSGGPPSSAPAGSPMSSPTGAASGFLGQAAATAAGVAGGAFLFEGVESLLGHHGSSVPGQEPVPTFPEGDVTINNYYTSNDRPERTGEDQPGRDGAEQISDSDSDFGSDDGEFV